VRKGEIERINNLNAKLLDKLALAKPLIINRDEWTSHCKKVNKMQEYL